MSIKLGFFILIQLGALIYFIETLRRVIRRASEHHLMETSSTLPLGFIKLRYLVTLYVIGYLVWVVGSIVLYAVFIHSGVAVNAVESAPARDVILDL